MIAARQIAFGGSAKKWENPYITDGLVAMWDGEWNAGGGKHSNTQIMDIFGGRELSLPNTDFAINQDCFSITIHRNTTDVFSYDFSSDEELLSVINSGVFTIEFSRFLINSELAAYNDFQICNASNTNLLGINSSGFNILGAGTNSWINILPSYSFITRTYLEFQKATIALVVNGTTVQSYVNGVAKVKKTLSAPITTATKLLLGGAEEDIYSVRINSRELNSEDLLYNSNIDKARFNI